MTTGKSLRRDLADGVQVPAAMEPGRDDREEPVFVASVTSPKKQPLWSPVVTTGKRGPFDELD